MAVSTGHRYRGLLREAGVRHLLEVGVAGLKGRYSGYPTRLLGIASTAIISSMVSVSAASR